VVISTASCRAGSYVVLGSSPSAFGRGGSGGVAARLGGAVAGVLIFCCVIVGAVLLYRRRETQQAALQAAKKKAQAAQGLDTSLRSFNPMLNPQAGGGRPKAPVDEEAGTAIVNPDAVRIYVKPKAEEGEAGAAPAGDNGPAAEESAL
jgi:preprotein translocase subunit SecG